MGDMQEKCDCRRPDITIFEMCRSCGNPVNFEDLRQQAVDTYDKDGQPIEDVTLPRRHLLMGNPRSSLRVLHLDNDASPILSGTFERASITHLPSYEAVSYCWGGDDGDYTKSEFIIIGGRLFPITKNCAAVLRKIRKTNSKRVIWVDSLCINQNDVKERSVQVSQMGQIFSGAQKVHIFLGNSVDNTTASKAFYVLNSMRNLNEFSMKLRNGAESVKALFAQTYFSRMWIIQEALLAKSATLHWGTATVPWQTLSKDHLEEFKKTGIDSCIPEWMRIRATTTNFRNSETLGELLFSAMGSTASNDRDKVYGIYGLLFDAELEGLIVDYSLSVREVFTNMAVHLIKKHNALPAVIRHVDRDAPPVDGEQLPSWVPDFRSRCVPKHTKMSFEGFNELEIYSRISSEEVFSSIGEKGLCLRGRRLRIVKGGSGESSTEESDGTEFETAGQELSQGIRAKFPVAFNHERDVVFWISNGLALHLKRHAAQENTYTLLGECYLKRPAPLPTVIVRNRRKYFAETMTGLGLQDVACLWKVYKALEDLIRCGSLWDDDMPFGLLHAHMNMEEAIRAAKAYRDFCGGEVFNDPSWELYSEQQQDAAFQTILVLGEVPKADRKVKFDGIEGTFGWLAYEKAYNTKWWRDQQKHAIKRMVDFQNFWEDLGTWEKLHRFNTLLQHPESYGIYMIMQHCDLWLRHYKEAERLIPLLLGRTSGYRNFKVKFLEELKVWEVATKGLSKALQWTEGFFWPFKRPPSVHVCDRHEEKSDNKTLFGMLRFWRDDKTENGRTEEVEEDSPDEQKGTPNWVIKNNFESVRLRLKKCQAGQREFRESALDSSEYVLQPWRDGWLEGIGSISRLLTAKNQLNLEDLFRLEESCVKCGVWKGEEVEMVEICQAETITLV